MSWIIESFRNTFNFSGRARRTEYWLFYLFTIVISFIMSIVDIALGLDFSDELGVFTLIFLLIILIPGLSVTVRRLHDSGKSGFWILLNFIPLIGNFIVFILTLLDSQSELNQYGPNPKKH
ncbi:DUF805 domain-containing protein [Sporosarcina sp. E16_8]|uniref:DUF805 domain-containing protein n=1 Tax=Sporosarcina sp. E16_8 TaxID=2789295 RepID=UPI001A92E63A|nr:DUF805 domain-containing protein [Sporosarcina sp. E16_8]MBO0589251.1 DUF805 domain-containing protein [Sporosarcina sp. E16_8]